MNKIDKKLEHVHTLYLLQVQLYQFLDSDLTHPKTRKEVREHMKKYQEMLHKADHRYMGGEDVLESLKALPNEIVLKLKTSPVAVAKLQSKKRKK
jgi:hypothetical protein